jgi:N4-gp56 family major capsid protein
MPVNLTTNFTDSTASDATQSIFNTLLLVRGTYALVHQVPVKKYPLARRSGKTMIWRRYEALPLATTPLAEGTNPASGLSKTKTDVAATIAPYGSFIEDSDMVIDTQPDPHTLENVELLGQQMGETFDALYRDLFANATNIVYSSGSSTLTVDQIVDRNDLDRAYRLLKVNKARTFSPMIMAGQNVGTGPVMPSYWAMCDERVAFDLRHVEGFLLPSEYSQKTGILAGEFGADKNGIRFLCSPNGYFLPGASGQTASSTLVKNTGGFVDVYSIFICGQECVGGVNLANGNGGIIRKALGSAGTADPLNMRATVGWKKYDARAILNQNFMVEIQTAVSL